MDLLDCLKACKMFCMVVFIAGIISNHTNFAIDDRSNSLGAGQKTGSIVDFDSIHCLCRRLGLDEWSLNNSRESSLSILQKLNY